ncbi:MAG: ABC transporter ATP-binding protein [Chitinophagales bacterium]|jgi:ATP-binding cassette subfamily B protein|nr:ABC transporter ATP-binding protein [Chitinophagales bacterium]
MQILFSYLKKYWKLLVLALVLAAINQIFSMLDPFILGKMIDSFANKLQKLSKDEFFEGVTKSLLLLIGVAMVSRIAKNFQDYFLNVIIQKTGADIYSDGIEHSLELPYEVFEDQRSGETLGMLQKVRTDMEKLMTSLVNVLFTSIIGIIWVVIYSVRVYWVIAPIYFSAIPIIGIISSILSRKIKKMQKQIVAETTALAGATTESLRNIELVKSLGLAQQEITHLNSTTAKILGLELKKVRYVRSLSFVQGTCVNFLRVSILGVMMYLIFSQKITVGEFTTLFIYSFFIFGPLQELGNIINVYREAEVSLANFKQIMETPKEFKPLKPSQIGPIDHLEFEGVSFKHQSSKHHALKNISFTATKGETLAFVGPSGSGKTTLVKLLVGLYKPESGTILYNGVEGKDIDLDELREEIGFVTQDTQLFSGTIKENLLFVNPNATDEQIMEVLQKASCQSLLNRADKGIDTMIGEGGVKVSGGEKQRLSVARALLRNPTLMVFDEATSALDSLTEEEITATIRQVSINQKQITIMIAHRLSTIMHADKIYVLERGKIIEEGRHESLVAEKGLYYAMWRQQIGERKYARETAV